ncbi:hypothetical protein SDC9_41586 [bioreactor metagenome]|uniref:Putative amidase domain-containing protein n=4 Tax=root TaxID=1 RepID=A0A0W1JLJ7_DESHA|nr:amidase domain-containing protein [Desulfitobacterium hafniense]EHL07523.1 hypothetical protein HMPREF0322_01874 [Desulfitobacterium hafniense DP7]KTE92620.1 hypothetical protein AT727_18085 [Desulfitobacterium hafniense]
MKKRFVLFLSMIIFLAAIPINIYASISEIDEDAVKNTIEAYFDLQNEIVIHEKDVELLADFFTDPESNKFYNFQSKRLEYSIQKPKILEYSIADILTKFDYKSIDINDDFIIVDVVVDKFVKLNFDEKYDPMRSEHRITLKNIDNKLYIEKDEYTDEFMELYGMDCDFDQLIQDLKDGYAKILRDNIKYANDPRIQESELEPSSSPGDYYVSYNRSNAVYYARLYSDNNGHSTSNYNNAQFSSYGTNDCQNFVSQCIWYGFGGRNSANKDLPMTAEWWANKTGTNTNWYWVNTAHFYNYITGNYASDNYGVRGITTSIASLQPGDYVYDTSNGGHVMFVSKVGDTNGDGQNDLGGIEICAHTYNHKDYRLIDTDTNLSNCIFVKVFNFKWNNEF